MAKSTVDDQLAKIQKRIDALKAKESVLRSKANGAVISEIINLAKKHSISADEIVSAMGKKSSVKAKAGPTTKKPSKPTEKVAPKYRDPANPENTWTGRGKSPKFIQALKDANLLHTALIIAA